VWLFPVMTAFVVLATGHHYVLDIVAGAAVIMIAVQLTRWLARRGGEATDPRLAVPSAPMPPE
jgi:membrane-associated phospholipid phosphatase